MAIQSQDNSVIIGNENSHLLNEYPASISSGQLNSMMMSMKMNRQKTKTPVFAQTAQSTFQNSSVCLNQRASQNNS
jgi:hypothetical protein